MLRQAHRTIIRPQTTAHLAQTMTLLELSNDELRQKIERELASNPALEISNEIRCPSCHRILNGSEPCPTCSKPKITDSNQPIVFISPTSSFVPPNTHKINNFEEEHTIDDWAVKSDDLATYVLKQLTPDLQKSEEQIAYYILSSLDDDGLLKVPLIEIAYYFHKPISKIKKVLDKINHSDPLGVGSLTPKDALLVQLESLEGNNEEIALAKKAIEEGLTFLGHHAYNDLGKLLKISPARAKEITKFISENLNPYPARAHWGTELNKNDIATKYINPDIIIKKSDNTPNDSLIVEVISPYIGSLRVNPLFQEAIKNSTKLDSQKWQSEYERAVLLVKCIQQRDNTIVRLIKRLVVIQKEYILKGDAYLRPITRAKLAEDLQVHESTISRAVSKKIIQLPNKKIIPMSKLFDRSLRVRTALRKIIANEKKPLNDSQIATILTEQGFPVARRTVAKYRTIEGILPARLRKYDQPTKLP